MFSEAEPDGDATGDGDGDTKMRDRVTDGWFWGGDLDDQTDNRVIRAGDHDPLHSFKVQIYLTPLCQVALAYHADFHMFLQSAFVCQLYGAVDLVQHLAMVTERMASHRRIFSAGLGWETVHAHFTKGREHKRGRTANELGTLIFDYLVGTNRPSELLGLTVADPAPARKKPRRK